MELWEVADVVEDFRRRGLSRRGFRRTMPATFGLSEFSSVVDAGNFLLLL